MKQRHQKVTPSGKQTNMMKNAVLHHSKKHEKKGVTDKDVDILPDTMRKG